MHTLAVVLEGPERLCLQSLELNAPGADDAVVEVAFSGISTGTERLLWTGRMPSFPGMGYPLVPGYESVGTVISAGAESGFHVGQTVFVPGAACYRDARGLFGGAARTLIAPGRRLLALDSAQAEPEGVLLALAATAYHAVADGAALPQLIVGHGVLGRLIARVCIALGGQTPTVWETNSDRRVPGPGVAPFDYPVLEPTTDPRRDYAVICDASGAPGLLDGLIARLAPRGEIVLAGFYEAPLSFNFPPAFMREARLRIAAEFKSEDLVATHALIRAGKLRLEGLITHTATPIEVQTAYRTAFEDPVCLKMVLDWRNCA